MHKNATFFRQFTVYCNVDILIGGRDLAFGLVGLQTALRLHIERYVHLYYCMEADQITITNEKQMRRGQTVDIDQDKMI